MREVYHQLMFLRPSLQSAQREYLPLEMPKLWWIHFKTWQSMESQFRNLSLSNDYSHKKHVKDAM